MTNELEKAIKRLVNLRREQQGRHGDEIQLLIIALAETILTKRNKEKYLDNIRKLFDL